MANAQANEFVLFERSRGTFLKIRPEDADQAKQEREEELNINILHWICLFYNGMENYDTLQRMIATFPSWYHMPPGEVIEDMIETLPLGENHHRRYG